MSSIVEPQQARPLPSVTVQVARGVLAAGVIIVAFLLVTAAVTGRQPWVGERWVGLFGDSRIGLADGVVPSEAAVASTVLTADPAVLRLGSSTAPLERAVGAPVRLLPHDPAMPAEHRSYSTPMGVVSFLVPLAGTTPLVIVRGGADAPVARTAADRRALVARIDSGIGFTSADRVPAGVSLVVREQPGDNGGTSVRVLLQSDGQLAAPGLLGLEQYEFAADGRFVQALVEAAPVVSVEKASLRSAASAYDDLRHHRASIDMSGSWGPVSIEGFAPEAGTRIVGGTVDIPPVWGITVDGGLEAAIFPRDEG